MILIQRRKANPARSAKAGRGQGWERVLDAAHDRYRRAQTACIFQTQAPVKQLGSVAPNGTFLAIRTGEGPPDFMGTLTDSGRGVIFDAKSCEADRWPLSGLALHQARDLEAAPHAFAFVALRMADASAWVLPWANLSILYWAWRAGEVKRGGASLDAATADRLGWRFDARSGDWIAAVPPEVLHG